MPRDLCLAVLLTLLPATLAFADALAGDQGKLKVQPVIPLKAQAFSLEDVRLLDGPFKHAMELNQKYLLSLETDRLLHTFRLNAGIPSTAQPLGGWEEPRGELRGHFLGHYLSACALMYASTGDVRLKNKANAIVTGLAECQTKLGGTGYLSAFPETFFDRVEKRQRVWAPYYTLHKIYAGLLDVYVYCDNPQALDVCKKFGDWVIARNAKLTDEQMQNMLGEEHGGMNEVLANLYGLTGEEKYLKIAQRFNHMAVLGPASQKEDKLTGLHANTQDPKFVGAARQYELTGQEWLKTASLFFWNTVVKERSYVIGGHSDGEHFSAKERLSTALGPNTTETCNTYNMLKLTRHLFCWDPLAEYGDFCERATYNHILASQNPETGGMCYYVPLRSGSQKTYGGPLNAFWCCTGTGVENHAKYGDSIYYHSGAQSLFVNLFIASELNWKDKSVKVRQETQYPEQSTTRLLFTCDQPADFTLNIRHPWWATSGITITLNGAKQTVTSQPSQYAAITRTWKTGDVVEISMPFTVRMENFRDDPGRFALMHGPLVLCAEVDTKKPFPAVVANDTELLSALHPVPGKPSTFTTTPNIFRIPGLKDTTITLEPFYKMHGARHYQVYFDSSTPARWQTREEQYRAEQEREKLLEARTVDSVTPGQEQNERDHNLRGSRMSSGDANGRNYRHATAGGWFSWQLKVLPDQPQDLVLTYWGSDSGRTFDILVDGTKLATETLANQKPGQFFDQTYPLPPELLKGKEKITLRIQSTTGSYAGGVFGARVMKK